MEPTIDRAIAAVAEGNFEAADYGVYSYMTHGGGSLAPMDTEVIPAEILELVDAREQEILTGLFRVNVNDSEPTSTN
jgi:basic membrane lipoprotein Med (substrate-binding protein (PBP1-ABC) superfamily)